MLARKQRLSRRSIEWIWRRPRYFKHEGITFVYRRSQYASPTKVAVMVNTKQAPQATQRNLWRRRLYDSAKKAIDNCQNYQIICVYRRSQAPEHVTQSWEAMVHHLAKS